MTPKRLFMVLGFGWFLDDEDARLVFARVLSAPDQQVAHDIGSDETKSAMVALSMVVPKWKLTGRAEFADRIIVTDLGALTSAPTDVH